MCNKNRKIEDFTKKGLQGQLEALGVDSFEAGILNKETGEMERRGWTKAQFLKSIPWLKFKNSTGHHIYLRPAEGSIILLDDLSRGSLSRMREEGVHALCIVETSELNYQAWVRISNDKLPIDLLTSIGGFLAAKFNADLNSKDWRHLGRAVGFTNVKPAYIDEKGKYPFVKLIEVGKGSIENAQKIINEGNILLQKKEEESQGLAEKVRNMSVTDRAKHLEPADRCFEKSVDSIYKQYGSGTDGSRADWAAAKRMIFLGYDYEEIAGAMLVNPSIQERKKGHVEHYVYKMTLQKLFNMSKAGLGKKQE